MCTLSWRHWPGAYELYFSRDEQRRRAPALPPRYDEARDCLMPLDPAGGGTWLAVNRSGLSLCLLNDYAQNTAVRVRQSRGSLVRELIARAEMATLESDLRGRCGDGYAPYVLVALSPESKPRAWRWDGLRLAAFAPRAPLCSSAVLRREAQRERRALWARLRREMAAETVLPAFHASHEPGMGALSVCMHRSDAQTVSLSHVRVDAAEIRFRYQAGPPCQARGWREITMARTGADSEEV
ncbi:MAG: NRDE family protein [Gammaproteobacteria bacterium]|nr:NRDE family protein [Gammaproteobacteria bacterium]